MVKKVAIDPAPRARKANKPSSEDWVKKSGPKRRFTFELPEELHRHMKAVCARRGTRMGDEMCALVQKHFAAET